MISEDSFENNRYYIKRLEQRDPKLFKYKGGDSYARKCQASNNMQPLVVTRDELAQINEAFKKYNASHKDLYAIEKSGNEVALEGFRIDGRDPDLIYICPDYWDRKNQMILDPRLTLQDDHPIDGVPMETIVYSKKNREDSRYVLRRNNGKYQLRFIQNVHPDGYALPCCNLRPTDYKVGSKVYVKEGGEWIVGVIKNKRDMDGSYNVEIGSDIRKVHISRIDKYRQDGSSNSLSQGFPLLEGTYGYAPDIIKQNYWMDPSYPNISQVESFGWMRYGILRDKDSFLRSFHVALNQQQKIKRSFEDFKNAIIHDIFKDEFPIRTVDGGRFVQSFRSESLFSRDAYSLNEMMGRDMTPETVEKMERKEKIKMLDAFIIQSAKENFKRYLFEESEHDYRILASLLEALSSFQGKTFTKKYSLTIICYREINERIDILRWGYLSDKGYVVSFYLKDDVCEPLYFYSRGLITPMIRDHPQKISLKVGVMVVYEDHVAQIKDIEDDIVVAEFLQSDEVVRLPRSECVPLDASILYRKIREICGDPRIPESPLEIPPLSYVLNLLPHYQERYKATLNIEFLYRDQSQKMTHLLIYDQTHSKPLIIPLKPTSITNNIKIRDISRLPKIAIDDQLELLKRLDALQSELGDAGNYQSYSDNLRLLLNKRNKITHLWLASGSLIKVSPMLYQRKRYPYPTVENDAIINLSYEPLTGFYNNATLQKIEDIHEGKSKLYQKFAQIYILLQEKNRYQEIDEIRYHPMMLGITKRLKIKEILTKYIDLTIDDSQVKALIEILYANSSEEVERLLIHPPLTLSDVRQSSDSSYIFTQRQILNRDHEDIFRYHSLSLRTITSYDHYKIEKKKRNHTKLDTDMLVSYYTKYPNSLHKAFPTFKLYQHIGGDEPITYASVITYAIDYPGLNAQSLGEIVKTIYHSSEISEDLLEAYNEYQPISEERTMDELLHDLEDPEYRYQIVDLRILSYASIYKLKQPFGFVIYTNRYSDLSRPYHYQLKFAIHEDCITTEDAIDDLRLICLYEDATSEPGQTISLKNLIFSEDQKSISLKECREKSTFDRAWKKYRKSLMA